MKNLKIISINFLKFITIIIIFLLFNKNVHSLENKILFKINDLAYTFVDYQKRLKYLEFIGSNKNLNDNIIIEDLISVLLFYEYYKNAEIKKNYTKETNDIYLKIEKININNNKLLNNEINKEDILFNIEIDLIRKNIIEDFLREKINKLNTSNEKVDLLYKHIIKYINLESEVTSDIIKQINELSEIEFQQVVSLLESEKIEFFIKEKEINNLKKIDKRIKSNILLNKNFFYIENKNKLSIIFIYKSFETYEGIIADLFSIKSKKELNNKNLDCKNLSNNKSNLIIENKEYKFKDLNNQLKSNLININDYVKYTNNNEYIYIVLCNIKFDEEILNNFKFNKLINFHANEIERDFVEKFSKFYNLVKNNE